MTRAAEQRKRVAAARRIVIKVGSRALAREPELFERLAGDVAALVAQKRCVILVSSGAIAIGCERLGYRVRPKEMGKLQAAAAAGQSVLMRRYDEAFAARGVTAAQVLLTHSDLADRERLNNARDALGALLEAGAVPVVNENDTVATDEIRFGDNDQLAAMVVPLVGAELLILLTDVEGVLDTEGKRIRLMEDDSVIGKFESKGEQLGTGGILSKLDAATKARRSGAAVVIAQAASAGVLAEIVAGNDVGTLFAPLGEPLRARKHWIAYTLRPRGDLLLDAGAVRALSGGKSSLLPVGVLGVRGDFHPGDVVRLISIEGTEVGRGLTRLGAPDVARAAGRKGRDLENLFGIGGADVVIVHKDDLVLSG